MATISPVDAVFSLGQRIGRYFALVSMLPSFFLVLWVYLLLASGGVGGKPAFRKVEVALSHWSAGKVVGLIVVALAVALVLHPLQFAATQLLEGYWGTTPLAIAAMKMRIVYHRKRSRHLYDLASNSDGQLAAEAQPLIKAGDTDVEGLLESRRGDPLMLYEIARQEAADHAERYPSAASRIMPTELGNALRCFEDAAGVQYGLKALTISPHLHLVAPQRQLDYLIDARQEMDTIIRICTVGLIATVLTAAALFTDGVWLLWAVPPYIVSYLAYKGAVSSAQNYGVVFRSVLDLSRFELYKGLGVYAPRDSDQEHDSNTELMKLLAADEHASIRYRRDLTP
jgi:hypothetical protein